MRSSTLSLKNRFFTIAALLSASAAPVAFAQELPAPADIAPPTPVRATPTPQAQPPAQPTPPPVTIITDTPPSRTAPNDWLKEPPVRVAPDAATPPESVAGVGGVPVYGLSDLEALQNLKAAFAPKLQADVLLDDGSKQWLLRRDEMGATIPYRALLAQARAARRDVPLQFEVDVEQAKRAMEQLAERVNRVEKVEETANGAANGTTNWVRVKMALEGSALRVKAALEAQPSQSKVALAVSRMPVAAPTETPTPATTPDAPEGFPHLLAVYSSPYDARIRGRTNNLRLAAKSVNGTVVQDGAIFSANRAIGPRTIEDGWREAKMFVSGQVVTGVGAGICQCASTIYNAALLAGLPIVERHPHMFRVPYVPASRDATLFWRSKDFRFKNNTGGPIYVETFLRGRRFHARLWGTQPKQGTFLVESRTLSRKGGTVSEAYRIAKTAEGTTRMRLSRDVYRPHP